MHYNMILGVLFANLSIFEAILCNQL